MARTVGVPFQVGQSVIRAEGTRVRPGITKGKHYIVVDIKIGIMSDYSMIVNDYGERHAISWVTASYWNPIVLTNEQLVYLLNK